MNTRITLRIKSLVLAALCLAMPWPGAFAVAEAAQVAAPQVTLQFSGDGRVGSFLRKSDGAELLSKGEPGLGFYLRLGGAPPLRLDRVEVTDSKLVVSVGGTLPRVTFGVNPTEDYLALRIERVEGVPALPGNSLHLEINLTQKVSVFELDYMTEARVSPLAHGSRVSVDWPHLWNRSPDNPLGGVAIFCPKTEQEEDEAILKIWVQEGLPHPRVEGAWDLAAAHAWIDQWIAEFTDQSRFWLSARTPEELYGATAYAEQAGVRDVYLFTDTWRGGDLEPFWTRNKPVWGINQKVFPRGEEDLRAFSDYLRERRMHLKLHTVSGGIGLGDPNYVAQSPDARLASWGRGQLVGSVQTGDTTLVFRPENGVTLPYRVPALDWPVHYTCPPTLHPVYDFEYMVVGDELIRVGSFSDTDQSVWRLNDCQRGVGSTSATSHADGEAVRGLISAYNQQLLPDNDSTLLGEVAENLAEMFNRCGIAHVEYDGAEIHCYNGRQWGFAKFASLVYSHLDHPVTSYTSGGNTPPCHIEYRLNATRNLGRERQKGIVGIMPEQAFRPATNLLDAHWGLSQMCAHGYTVFNIMKPEPLFGLDLAAMRAHGLTKAFMEIARDWKRVNQLITDGQREQMRKTLYFAADAVEQAGSHEKSEIVHVLEKVPHQWEIYPTRVLKRPGKLDTVWHDGQEHGAISPRQFLKPGEAITLENPYAAQVPRIVMRVLWALDYDAATVAVDKGIASDTRGADKAFEYAKMLLSKAGDRLSTENLLLQPVSGEMRNQGDMQFHDDGNALVIARSNPLPTPVVVEDKLPEWSRSTDMSHHRAVGMWVTGDGSGALLTLQIPGGDYVVPIDFTGRRYVEIPSAQVAWAAGYWGWRMGSKRTYYEAVNWMKLGFGVMPANTNAEVRIEGIKALREQPVEIKDAILHAGDSSLTLHGAVASGQYLTWEGGDTATVFDANWNRVSDIPVTSDQFLAPMGDFSFYFESQESAPWIEIQVLTRDAPITIPDSSL